MASLLEQQCQHQQTSLATTAQADHLQQLHEDWSVIADTQQLIRTFKFKNYYETMAFVNLVAWISHQQDHHPDMEVGYNRCIVHYRTHSVDGLSLNDFICAAHIDKQQ